MKSAIALSVLLAAPLFLGGCASSLDKSLDREEALHERLMEREAELAERNKDYGQDQIDSLPEWVITKPRPDSSGMYGIGIGESIDLTQALRKSNLQARYDVAKEVNMQLSGEETAVGSSDNDYRYVVDAFVKEVNMSGTEDVAREIQSGPRGFRVYTMVKLPYDEFNNALTRFGNAEGHESIEKAYQRLRQRVREANEAEKEEKAAAREQEQPVPDANTAGNGAQVSTARPAYVSQN